MRAMKSFNPRHFHFRIQLHPFALIPLLDGYQINDHLFYYEFPLFETIFFFYDLFPIGAYLLEIQKLLCSDV
jgi:hypothetical protein